MMYCEEIEISVKDNPEEVFEFIRVLKNLETLYEMSIFNKEEMREIENLENFFQLPLFKEEFNYLIKNLLIMMILIMITEDIIRMAFFICLLIFINGFFRKEKF